MIDGSTEAFHEPLRLIKPDCLPNERKRFLPGNRAIARRDRHVDNRVLLRGEYPDRCMGGAACMQQRFGRRTPASHR